MKEDVDKRLSDGVRGVPTFQFYHRGNLVDKIIGADMPAVKEKLNQLRTLQ